MFHGIGRGARAGHPVRNKPLGLPAATQYDVSCVVEIAKRFQLHNKKTYKTRERIHKAIGLIFGSLVLILAACNGLPTAQAPLPATAPAGTSPAGGSPGGNVANGEQIYFRGVDQQGNNITYTGGPSTGGMMMGGYLTCASCHGPGGHGGTHIMMGMQTMDAPPIYFGALIDMAKNDAGLSTYSFENFREAVVQGQDVDGSALSQDMPRWQMSDQDLADLFAFLQTLH